MRILHILEATSGGTRRHVLDLLPALHARGIECSLVYSALRNPAFREDAAALQKSGVETIEITMGHRWARREDSDALRALRRHLRENSYDAIHCHSSNAGLLGRLANMGVKRLPLIYTPHYVAFAAGIPRLQRRAALYLEKLLASHTTHFIAVSNHERELLQRVLKLQSAQTTTIYNGVSVCETLKPSSLIPHPSSLTIGCFGRLTPQKNQALLIRALPFVLKEFPGARLLLVGGGEDEKALRHLASKLGCAGQVDFQGDITDVRARYYDCDIIAHPSRWEGCSYALLEAMASARPIIASDAGGNPEVLGDTGLLLASQAPSVWATEINALGRDASRLKVMGDRALDRVRYYFPLGGMVDKTITVYKNAKM